MSTPPVLSTENLSKRFGGIVAADSVTFEVDRGHTKGLIGPNGAGKTTLLNCLSGLYDVSGGKIFFEETDVTDDDPHEMAQRGLGRTFQITNLFNEFTVFENLRLASQIHTTNSYNIWSRFSSFSEPQEVSDEVLSEIGLADKRDVPVANLSHGEKRQLEIGIVMATDPDLMLLDEPTAGMASDEIPKITGLIRELQEDKAIVLVEHNIDLIMELTDTIMVMNKGELIADDTPDVIKEDERVRRAYLGTSGESAAAGGG